MKIEQETSGKEQGMKRWELALAVFQKTLTVPCKALIMLPPPQQSPDYVPEDSDHVPKVLIISPPRP